MHCNDPTIQEGFPVRCPSLHLTQPCEHLEKASNPHLLQTRFNAAAAHCLLWSTLPKTGLPRAPRAAGMPVLGCMTEEGLRVIRGVVPVHWVTRQPDPQHISLPGRQEPTLPDLCFLTGVLMGSPSSFRSLLHRALSCARARERHYDREWYWGASPSLPVKLES